MLTKHTCVFEGLWFFQRLAAKVNFLLADLCSSPLLENTCQAPVEPTGGQLKRPNIHGCRKLTVYSMSYIPVRIFVMGSK